jgi:hypothetical protein
VVDSGERETYLPNALIPFRVDEAAAKRALKDWLDRTLLDKAVKVASGAALYVPVWAFDLSGSVGWRGLKQSERKPSTAELLFGGGRRGVQWVAASGDQPVLHGNVLVLAAGKWAEACLGALKAFNLDEAAPYDEGYLANWAAETYTLAVGDASLQARQQVLLEEQAHIRAGLGGQVRDLTFISSGLVVDSFRLLLLPVWMAIYTLGEKRFQVVINGQSGAVFGQKP